jgi:hypothetical protein
MSMETTLLLVKQPISSQVGYFLAALAISL